MYNIGTYTGIEMSTFCTCLNTGCTGHLLGIPADFGCTDTGKKKEEAFFF